MVGQRGTRLLETMMSEIEQVTSSNGANGRQERCLPRVKGRDGKKRRALLGLQMGRRVTCDSLLNVAAFS